MHSTYLSEPATYNSRAFVVDGLLVMVTWEGPLTVVTTDQPGALRISAFTNSTPMHNESSAIDGAQDVPLITELASLLGSAFNKLKRWRRTTESTSGHAKS